MNVFICDVCSKEFISKRALGGHKSAAHKDGPRYSVKRTVVQKSKEYFCQFCNRKTINAGANKKHENTCKNNPKPVKYRYHNKGGRVPWNKGLTKETSYTIRKYSENNSINYRGENNSFYGKKHSEETKDKISKSRKKFIEENPHMSPWVYSHYTKRKSYAERYWKKIFTTFGLNFEEQHPVSRYCLDFAVLEYKIDIEIDGEQHYHDQKIVKSDIRRTEYLESVGWKVIRIRWSDYKKLPTKHDRKQYIISILNEIRSYS